MNKEHFRDFVKHLGLHFSNGQWRLPIGDGQSPLTPKEQELNDKGGRPFGKNAGRALIALADYGDEKASAILYFLGIEDWRDGIPITNNPDIGSLFGDFYRE